VTTDILPNTGVPPLAVATQVVNMVTKPKVITNNRHFITSRRVSLPLDGLGLMFIIGIFSPLQVLLQVSTIGKNAGLIYNLLSPLPANEEIML